MRRRYKEDKDEGKEKLIEERDKKKERIRDWK